MLQSPRPTKFWQQQIAGRGEALCQALRDPVVLPAWVHLANLLCDALGMPSLLPAEQPPPPGIARN
jgi:hypothetical protein